MATRTTHVIPTKAGWTVIRADTGAPGVFYTTKKDAVSAALRVLKTKKAGQVVVHERNGGFHVEAMRGLPKIQRAPRKSKLGRKAIQKAVSTVVRERLMKA